MPRLFQVAARAIVALCFLFGSAQAGMAIGSGTGAVLIVPAGKALCVTTHASVSGTIGMTYQQI